MSNAAAARALAADLDAVAASIDDARLAEDAAALLAPLAAEAARKRSGRMARGVVAQGPTVVALAPYSRKVHTGWHGIVPNPFLAIAADRGAERVADLATAATTDALTHLQTTYRG